MGSATASSVIAPPFQRIVTVARRCSRTTSRIDFLDQAAQQLLAVAVGGRRRGPHAAEVGAERQQLLALCLGERPRALVLAQRELGLGVGELAERVLPVALEAAGDEPVLGLDLAVAALGPLGLVLGALDLQPPLLERGVVVLLERLGGVQRGLHAGGGERGQQRAGDRLVDLACRRPAGTSCRGPRPGCCWGSDRRGSGARAGPGSGRLQLAPAAAADRDPLQQRGALADRAAGLVRARARVGAIRSRLASKVAWSM